MTGGKPDCPAAVSKSQAWAGKSPRANQPIITKHFGPLVVCYQNQIVPTQGSATASWCPPDSERHSRSWQRHRGEPRCRHGHQRDRWSRARRTGSDDRDRPGLAAGRLTTDRESEAVHPKAQPPRPPTPRQRAVGKQCRGPSVEAFLFGQSPGNWAYPASPSESTLRLQVHLSIRTGSSLLTLDHVEPPSVHNNRPVVSGQSRQGCPFIRGLLRSDRVTITATHGVTRSWRWGLSQSSNWITIGLTQQPLT